MKKIIILSALMLSFCAIKAQECCPSRIELRQAHVTGRANHFRIKLLLYNSSQNLNGFGITINKPSLAKSVSQRRDMASTFLLDGKIRVMKNGRLN